MFDFDIRLSNKSSNDKVILNLPIYYYITFVIIGTCLFFTTILYGTSIIALIVLFISVAAITFKETWVFDKSGSFYKTGLGFVYRKIDFDIKDIEVLEMISFYKGRNSNVEENSKFSFLNKKFYSLKIHLNNGKDYTLITVAESKKEKIDQILKEVSMITKAKIEV